MMSPNLLRRKPNSIFSIHVLILIALITQAACSATPATPTASPIPVVPPTTTTNPNNPTAIVLPSATATSSSLVSPFPLTGDWVDHRDCHIKPGLILIYRKPDDDHLDLVRLGSHSELDS